MASQFPPWSKSYIWKDQLRVNHLLVAYHKSFHIQSESASVQHRWYWLPPGMRKWKRTRAYLCREKRAMCNQFTFIQIQYELQFYFRHFETLLRSAIFLISFPDFYRSRITISYLCTGPRLAPTKAHVAQHLPKEPSDPRRHTHTHSHTPPPPPPNTCMLNLRIVITHKVHIINYNWE